jgi:methyl-accepting chemotaxis protein
MGRAAESVASASASRLRKNMDDRRSLAEVSAEMAACVAQSSAAIEAAVGSSSSSNDRFEQIVDLATCVRDQAMLVQSAVDEQSVGGKQVLEALTRMNQITARVRDDAKKLLDSSGDIPKDLGRPSEMDEAPAPSPAGGPP